MFSSVSSVWDHAFTNHYGVIYLLRNYHAKIVSHKLIIKKMIKIECPIRSISTRKKRIKKFSVDYILLYLKLYRSEAMRKLVLNPTNRPVYAYLRPLCIYCTNIIANLSGV